MKISYNQLKQYVSFDISPDELAELLTDIGLEVENLSSTKQLPETADGLVVGQILHVVPHPDADRLKVTQVDIGTGRPLQIVCGAPNVAVGQKVVVATVGATLYPKNKPPYLVKKMKIRGVESEGMICAEDEIGISENHEGIMILPDTLQAGSSVAAYFAAQGDYILDIALTANRSDATGHVGVARDIAAALTVRKGKKHAWHYPSPAEIDYTGDCPIQVVIENRAGCLRYSGIVLYEVKVGPSPEWLQSFLKNVGMRPVNNIVDIANFVMLEYGHPLHAFDAAVIEGDTIIVKTLPEGTPFVTLDGTSRKLAAHDLMICDARKPLCMAGVMGGINSIVTENTTTVFLESACFHPLPIRKTMQRHLLHTDAAQRFEKGTDPNTTCNALLRAAALMLENGCAKAASKPVDVYPEKLEPFPVTLSYKNIDTLAGAVIDRPVIKQVLQTLGIIITEEHNDDLKLLVPRYKTDVQREVDVIEEVLRIYGYNNIPLPKQVRTTWVPQSAHDNNYWKEKISLLLAGMGFYEILTNSIIHQKYLAALKWPSHLQPVRLLKSTNAELDLLRPAMLISGLETVAYNLNRKNNDLKLFEFGKTYVFPAGNTSSPVESEHLALYTTGMIIPEHWRSKEEKADFFYLKGVVHNLLRIFGIREFDSEAIHAPEWEYGTTLSVNQVPLVTLGLVSPAVLKHFDISQPVFHADFNWENVLKTARNKKLIYKDIPRYPSVRRDLSLLIDKHISFAQIEKLAYKEIKHVLKSVNLFDIYEDKKLGDNKKSYAVSFIFEDESRTLKDEEVDQWMNQLITIYQTELQAQIR